MICRNAYAAVALLLALAPGCGDDAGTAATTTGAGGSTTTGSTATGTTATTGSSAGGSGGAGGATPVDPCGDALFCEKFDDYAGITTLTDGQKLGPWRSALKTPGATMDLDSTHTTSGSSALHVHLDTATTSGGRLFAEGDQPIFVGNPTHIYGRMMMFIDPNGPSIHWTFFGASGDAEPSSPVVGRRATYLMSSLPKNGVNTYSFVYGLQASGNDPYQDCYFQSQGAMPTATWSCVEFELDSVSRKLRMYENGSTTPTVSVDETGAGCVGTVVPDDTPWYGPAIDQLYVGAWSFHDMDSPLDVWIDDLVVDTKPVACPMP